MVLTQLTNSDTKYWAPVPEVLKFLESKYAGARVLDVGPGHCPLPWATDSVDFVDVQGVRNLVKCDVTAEPIPFPDKTFDFVFCRHLLEDSWNPFPICKEMSRVGKAGYIETPSPICEMTRGVDGSSPPYRGYHHHRFMVWSQEGGLCFVSKYPLVEYLQLPDDEYVSLLRQGAKYWNTYHLWTDNVRMVNWQSPLHFNVGVEYGKFLQGAVLAARKSIDEFWTNVPVSNVIASLPQR